MSSQILRRARLPAQRLLATAPRPGAPSRGEFTWSGGPGFQKAPSQFFHDLLEQLLLSSSAECSSPLNPKTPLPSEDVEPESNWAELARQWSVVTWDVEAVKRWAELEVRLRPDDLQMLEKHQVTGMKLLSTPELRFKGTISEIPWGLKWTSMKKILAGLPQLVHLNAQVELGWWLSRADPAHNPGLVPRYQTVGTLLDQSSFVWQTQELADSNYELDLEASPALADGSGLLEAESVHRWIFAPRGYGKTTLISQLAREIANPMRQDVRSPIVVDAAAWKRHNASAEPRMTWSRYCEIQTGQTWQAIAEARYPRDLFIDNAHVLLADPQSRIFCEGEELEPMTYEEEQEAFDFWSALAQGLREDAALIPMLEGVHAPKKPTARAPLFRLWIFCEARGMDLALAPPCEPLGRQDRPDAAAGSPNNQTLRPRNLRLEEQDFAAALLAPLRIRPGEPAGLAATLARLALESSGGHPGLAVALGAELAGILSSAPARLGAEQLEKLWGRLLAQPAFLQRVLARGLLGRELPPVGSLAEAARAARPDIFAELERLGGRELLNFWARVCRSQDLEPKQEPVVRVNAFMERQETPSTDPVKGQRAPPGPLRTLADRLCSIGFADWDEARGYVRPQPLVKRLWLLENPHEAATDLGAPSKQRASSSPSNQGSASSNLGASSLDPEVSSSNLGASSSFDPEVSSNLEGVSFSNLEADASDHEASSSDHEAAASKQ